jgi:hypothetical protein
MIWRGAQRFAVAALVVLVTLLPGSGAQFSFQQQSSPLRGQGVPSANVSDGIYISVFLDRLLGVDQDQYRFDAVLYTYVTWVDEDGIAQWFYNNIASNCADPSRADYYPQWCADFQALCKRFRNSTGAAQAAIREEGTTFLGAPMDVPCQTWNEDGTPRRSGCDRYCSNQYNVQDCCDGIFIPDIDIANIYNLDQSYTVSSQLMPQYDYRKDHYGAWMWSVNFHAIYFQRMNFRRFPWDTQQLLIQLKYQHDGQDLNTTSTLLPSSSGVLSLRPQRNGDDSSGWKVKGVSMEPYVVAPAALVRGKVNPPAVKDPVPLFQTAVVEGQRTVTGLEPVFTSRLNPGNSLLVLIEVVRYSSFYVVNNLVPIILSTCLGFFVFLLDGDDMEKRLTLLVTLFLALTALQFVISTNLPNSSYVLRSQALVLTGYALFTAMALESWLVYFLRSSHLRHLRTRAWRRAYKQYTKGVISAETLAEVTASCKGPVSDGGLSTPSDDPDEELEAPALAHIAGPTQQGKGTPASNGQTLPQHSSRPAVQRQTTLLQRVVGKRICHAATRRISPIKHDADYAEWLSQKVDRCSLCFLLVAYTAILIAVLVA